MVLRDLLFFLIAFFMLFWTIDSAIGVSVVNGVRVSPSQAFFNSSLSGFCNASSDVSNVSGFDFVWYNNNVSFFSGSNVSFDLVNVSVINNGSGERGFSVFVNDSYIFLANGFDDLYVYSFNGSVFSYIDHYVTLSAVLDVWVSGNYVYATSSIDGLFVFSFNGSDLVFLSNYKTSFTTQDVWVDGSGYVYVTDYNAYKLSVLSFDGSFFSSVANYSIRTPIGVWGDGSYVYVANYLGSEVGSFIFNGSIINKIGSYSISNARRVWGYGGYLYVASNGGLSVLSFNGSDFVFIDDFVASGYDVWGDGNFVYLATGGSNLSVFSFDGVSLSLVDSVDVGGNVNGVWGDGDYIYLANYLGGLRSYYKSPGFVNASEVFLSSVGGFFSHFDNVVFGCRANDSDGGSSWVNSSSLVISNYAPVLGNPSVVVSNASFFDVLNCSPGVFSDVDGDNESVVNRSWLWYRNNVSTGVTSQNISAWGYFNKSDSLICSERVFDGFNFSVYVNSSVFVWSGLNWSFNPSYFSGVLGEGESFLFNVSVFSGSLSNLSFNLSCEFWNSSLFSCVIAPNSSGVVNQSVNFLVNITSNSSTPHGSYSGNITFLRLVDGNVTRIPLSLGVNTLFGVPWIINKSDWSQTMYSDESVSRVFLVSNNGSYNLSNCSASIDGFFSGQSWVNVSFNDSVVLVNHSVSLSVSFVSPVVGLYVGYLQVYCVASPSGSNNSLLVPNRPYVILASNVRPVSPGGGGGGGGTIVVVSAGNRSLFSVETVNGASSVNLLASPGMSRSFGLIVSNLQANNLALSVVCKGDFCSNVDFDKSLVGLVGFGVEDLMVNISVPVSAVFGDFYSFDVVLSDNSGHSGKVVFGVSVSRLASFFSRFNVLVFGFVPLWFVLLLVVGLVWGVGYLLGANFWLSLLSGFVCGVLVFAFF